MRMALDLGHPDYEAVLRKKRQDCDRLLHNLGAKVDNHQIQQGAKHLLID